jgi:hypothetical protein
LAADGRIGMRSDEAVVPACGRMAARITDRRSAPEWASGSHVWNGNIGTLIAKPRNMPPMRPQSSA